MRAKETVRIFLVQLIARASEHRVIHAMQVNSGFRNVTRLYDSIYIRLPCKPGKKLGVLREGGYAAGHTIARVQTHVQSTVIAHLLLCRSDV